jgi:hypothetical protein
MATLENLEFGNGRVTYVSKVDPTPRTERSDTNGNVTINNITEAQPGRPAFYDVTFILTANFENAGVKFSNVFSWECVVPEESDRAQYRSVEDQAAKQIAPMLRTLADQIEADLPNFSEVSSTEGR